MQIFNLSHLFKTPVLVSSETNSVNKKSRRRRRRRRTQNPECVQIASDSSKCNETAEIMESPRTRSLSNARKEPIKKNQSTNCGLVASVKAIHSTTTEPASSTQRPAANKNTKNDAETKMAETMKQEMVGLIGSLQTLASEKDALEKNVNELREENDRLIKNNEDLKDELKEMTDEALELTVEKQRLLSKIGVLKKQLLNRPK